MHGNLPGMIISKYFILKDIVLCKQSFKTSDSLHNTKPVINSFTMQTVKESLRFKK